MKKFKEAIDITFSNPPYNGNLDLKIIESLNFKKLICVHPSSWLIQLKTQISDTSGSKIYRKFRKKINNRLKKVELFNGNKIFNIGLFVHCIISYFNFSIENNLIEVIFEKEKQKMILDTIDDVTIHGKNIKIIRELFKKIIDFTKNGENLKEKFHCAFTEKFTSDNDSFYVQIASMRGNCDEEKLRQDDFFTFLQKDSFKNKGIRKSVKENTVFKFKTEQEQDNFINFLKTDFARLCLSLTKFNQGIGYIELSLVPWLDFSKSWTDDELFSMFGFKKGHPLREYCKIFLPDYHNIGKNY